MNISEIAKLAGVSSATVSRYFNSGYLSEEKRSQIREVIERTGYVPSASARSLRTKKSKTIGVIVPKISSESISKIVNGISAVLNEKHYHIMLGNTENNVEKELEYLNLFKNNDVDGIVIAATYFTKKHIQAFQSLNMPLVILGQELEGFCCVYHDDYNAAREATECLIQAGCRKLAYLGVSKKDHAVGEERERGFLDALGLANLSVDKNVMAVCEFRYESGYENMKSLLEDNPDLDGIYCATDTIAAGAMEAIKEKGLRIPEDISIVGMGDSRMAKVVTPKLATARFYYEKSGKEAGNRILAMISSEEVQFKSTKLGYEVMKRASLKVKS